MEALFHFMSLAAPMVASSLLSAIWEGAVLALCVLLCLRLLPRLSAAARSVIWMNVFLLLLLLQFVPWLTARVSTASSGRSAPFQFDLVWSFAVAAAWLLLSSMRGIQLIAGAIRLHDLATRATPIDAGPAIGELLQIKTAGSKAVRTAELCASTEVARPSVLGFFHPRILIPPALLERLTPEELQQVVLHEMEHLRRADDWTNLLQKLALVLFPLNPALLWVERRLCAERELACDDGVLSSSCGRKAYARCLTHLAEYSMLRRGLSLALGAWERQSELVRRVHRILRRPSRSLSTRQTIAFTGGLTVAGLLCALALARSPQLVAFTPPEASSAQAGLLAHPKFAAPNRDNFEIHAQLVRAVMPQLNSPTAMSAASAAPAQTPVRKRATIPSMRRHYVEPQQAWVVMTEWTDMDAAPQVVFAVARDNRGAGKQAQGRKISYAAVPFANGWLIVRI